jgi:His/Glu/Gln/Arg/opine family amino acid ABC transporter permease subunit
VINLNPLVRNWRFLAAALNTTLVLSVLAMCLGLIVGTGVGILRAYGPRWLGRVLAFYVDTFRAIPLLVILIWTFFAFPLSVGYSLDPLYAGVLGLGLHAGAYIAEVIRGGLLSVRRGQMRAALALGMTRGQAIRTIILPQAAVRMLPPLGSQLVLVIKDSAIAAVIAVPELMRQSQVLASQTFRPFEIYTTAMLVYFLILYPIARGIDRVYRHLAPLGAS